MKASAGSDSWVLQALTSVGMKPAHLMALAFREIADNADKIGQRNISPEVQRRRGDLADDLARKIVLVRRCST
jgi:hypothetical protein